MSRQQHNVLAANWDPNILAAYMDGVEKGEDSDEAMSSGDSDSEGEFEESSFSSSAIMSDIEIPHPADIASDDSAFSSEDEFAEETITERQTTRRELVLGRPTAAIMSMRAVDLKEKHLEYMKQLDDADAELAEIIGVPAQVLIRRQPVLGYDAPVELGDDLEAYSETVLTRGTSGSSLSEDKLSREDSA
ncbi:hypothetical protein C8R43DRAFT_1029912 [Mycena crocata]|nr:hypothetical protein C8R43DRAFT_1029912 [Mycena crocata]